jgi:RNA processing factor Prp31
VLASSAVSCQLQDDLFIDSAAACNPVCPVLLCSDLRRAQLGLAHSYSRAKVKFNVNKVDNMVIQAIALLDTLDKDINTFIMRVREWYSWHFPELVKVR